MKHNTSQKIKILTICKHFKTCKIVLSVLKFKNSKFYSGTQKILKLQSGNS